MFPLYTDSFITIYLCFERKSLGPIGETLKEDQWTVIEMLIHKI